MHQDQVSNNELLFLTFNIRWLNIFFRNQIPCNFKFIDDNQFVSPADVGNNNHVCGLNFVVNV